MLARLEQKTGEQGTETLVEKYGDGAWAVISIGKSLTRTVWFHKGRCGVSLAVV